MILRRSLRRLRLGEQMVSAEGMSNISQVMEYFFESESIHNNAGVRNDKVVG